MRIEVHEEFPDHRIELRVYEIDDNCSRVLIAKFHSPEVWGFVETDDHPRQVSGKLVHEDKNLVIS